MLTLRRVEIKAESEVVPITTMSTAVNTDLTGAYIESLEKELASVKEELKQTQQNVHFRLQHISNDDAKVRFILVSVLCQQ